VENYLDKCITSVLNQTHKNIEVILVDDGSPDNSGYICDRYANEDERIVVIHKENGGLSDARNHGLRIAKGKYTLFVDSDDYILENAIEILFNFAERFKLDILNANANQKNGELITTLHSQGSEEIVDGQTYLLQSIKNKKYLAAVWLRMYKTEMLLNNNLFFKVALLHEDEQWTPKVFMTAKRVGYINYSFYYYLIRMGSITHAVNKEKHIKDVIMTCKELLEYLNKVEIPVSERLIFEDYFIRLYMNTVTFGEYNKKKYCAIISRFFPLKNSFFLSTRIKALLYFINPKLYREFSLRRKAI